MSRTRTILLAAAVVLGLVAPARAGDDVERKNKAIDKAIAYLKKEQNNNGTWDYENLHPKLGDSNYPMRPGIAAMGAFALLKAGVPPTDPAIQKSFAFLREAKIEHVYSAGLVLLAVDALHA